MELLVRMRWRHVVPADLRMEVEHYHTVGDLVAAASDLCAAGWEPNQAVYLERTAAPLDAEALIDESGIVSGDVLRFELYGVTPTDRASLLHAVSCDVTAGPQAGRSFVLQPGANTVGRGIGSSVVIDDPTVSEHQLRIDVDVELTTTVVPEPDAVNPVMVNGSARAEPCPVGPNDVVQFGATAIALRVFSRTSDDARDQLGQVPFRRTPHRPVIIRERKFAALGAVPTKPDPRRFSFVTTLLPLAGGLGMFMFTKSPMFLMMTGMTPVMAGANWWQSRRSGADKYVEQVAKYRARVERRRAEVDRAVLDERAERVQQSPDLADLARRATLRTLDLWPRQRGVEEFLRIRLGLGAVASRISIAPETSGEEQLREATAAALAGHETLPASPICVNLVELGVFGLHGGRPAVAGIGASIILQAVTLHSPEDLVLVVIEGAERGLGSWAKWLPHTRSSTSPIAGDHIVESPDRATDMLRELVAVARLRTDPGADRADHRWPWVLVVLDDEASIDPAIVSQLLELCPEAGISVVAMTGSEARVPRQARASMRCELAWGGALSTLSFTDPDVPAQDLEPEPANARLVDEVAMSLAPLRDATAATATSAIPRVVPLLSLFDGEVPTAQSVAAVWSTPKPYGLRAPIGVGPAGALHLDLVEHGPHALIGGTSGAGKSELLQSIVASLISQYPPTRLTFLFVDYKGGASSTAFNDVPHTVGYVTNLEASLSLRALTSLRAELNHRMRLMEGKAKDLAEMLERHPDEAPPSLVIVVDEFATLVKEVPDFVAGIVDIAQRGRSLGIHLILATQRPSGSVNDNILANTNLRISLRMLDKAESVAVISDKVAAEIPVPLKGRAYAKLGPRDLIEFQSAFTGAVVAEEAATAPVSGEVFGSMVRGSTTSTSVGPRRRSGATAAPLMANPPASGGQAAPWGPPELAPAHRPTHLDVVLDAARTAWPHVPPPRRPWCEMLPEELRWSNVPRAAGVVARSTLGRLVTVGLLDDPAEQAQYPAVFDLEEGGGLVIAGGGGSGKTSALRTIAVAATADATPEEVTLFVIDCASRSLGPLRDLPHCAEVATGDDVEAITRVISVLGAELDRRRRILSDFATQAESLTAYLDGGREMTRVVVLVDGYQNLHAMLNSIQTIAFGPLDWLAEFYRLLTDGRQVGIHLVVTVDRRQAIPPVMMSTVGSRLVLRQTDENAYSEYGIPLSMSRGLELPSGRGLWNGQLVQVGFVGDDPSAAGQTRAVAAYAARRDGAVPPHLRTSKAPDVLDVELSAAADLAVLGRRDVSGAPVTVSVAHGGLCVAGPPRSGRSTALRQVARSLMAAGRVVWTIGIGLDGGAGRHASGRADDVTALLDELANLCEMVPPDEPIVLVIDNIDRLEPGPALNSPFERLVKSDAIRFVGAIEIRNLAGFTQNPVLNEIRRQPSMLVLQPDSATETYHQTGVRVQLRPGLALTPGRGVLVADRQSALIQVAFDPTS